MGVSAYVAELVDTDDFQYEGGNYDGNLPSIKHFTFALTSKCFTKVVRGVNSGIYEGKQLDWGSVGAKLNKEGLLQVLNELIEEATEWEIKNEGDYLEKLRKMINELEDNKEYILCVYEY